ncbi:MAG: RNA 2',3'-cyclic phosphodiesterase, partial [Candidatus Bipolaricaulia bacterium]
MRTFFCIELDDEVKEGLEGIIQSLKRDELWRATRVSWVKRENLHITLKFLGEIAPERVEELRLAAEVVSEGLEPFSLELDLLGAFP